MWKDVGKGLAEALSKWYLNQNLLTLIVALTALGIGEHCSNLCLLKWVGLSLSIVCSLSVFATMIGYAWEYCWRKHWKAKGHKLDHNNKVSGLNGSSKSKETVCLNDFIKTEKKEYQLLIKITQI